MKIYTGNFANESKYIKAGLLPIGIARFSKWFTGIKMLELAPTGDMLQMNEEDYIPRFNTLLGKLDPKKIFQTIEKNSNGKSVVLLCYEKAGDFCHRRMVAEWLEQHLNIEVKEYDTNTQANLF